MHLKISFPIKKIFACLSLTTLVTMNVGCCWRPDWLRDRRQDYKNAETCEFKVPDCFRTVPLSQRYAIDEP